MSLLSCYLVKKNFIGLKDFRNFDVLLLLTNSFRRKFGFNLMQTWLWLKRWLLWPMIETLYKKKNRYFPRQGLFARKETLPGVFLSWEKKTGEYLFAGK